MVMVRFDESKHKRDERGRFSDKDKRSSQARQALELEKKYNDDLEPNTTKPEKAYGFANKERKETNHHKAHAKSNTIKRRQKSLRFYYTKRS